MRALTRIFLITAVLLTNQMFSQSINKVEFRPDNPLQERIIPHSTQDVKINHPSKSNVLNSNESRTLVNNTILDNGFLLIEEVRQNWDGYNWMNIEKFTYTYDVNNNLIEELHQMWLNSNWLNAGLFIYIYDLNNNLIQRLNQIWDGSSWKNYSKRTYTYDVNNNTTEMLRQDWGDSSWVDFFKYTFTYNIYNSLLEEIEQRWDGSKWVNDNMDTYTYDANNNLIELLIQTWAISNWSNIEKIIYAYDINNNRIERLRQEWDGSNWMNDTKTIYAHILTGIEQLTDGVKTYSLSNNYPNPFNPSTTISFQVPELSFVTLKVYDVLGNEIATLVNEEKTVGSYEVEFNRSELPSGIYFYRLKAGSFVETKKMVLMK